MAAPLLTLRDIHLTFGGTPLLTGAEFAIGAGERLALVGRNGSGKSTLLKIAAGVLAPDRGERVVQQGATCRYLPQEPDLSGHATTLAYVEAGLAPGDDAHRARYLLNELGLSGEEDPARLSGGEARRAALARALAPRPDILLLDEPTNHLDLPAIEWLEGELRALRSALVLISHDRRFLQNLSQATVWLDRGQTRRLDRGFAAFEIWRDETLEQEEVDRHKLDRKIVAEQDWLRYGVTARRKRNQGRLRALMALRQERRDRRRSVGTAVMGAAEADLSGKLVIEAIDIAKSFGDRVIVDGLSLRIGRGDRLAIIGPNGAGKSTLLKLLTATLPPDRGSVRHGSNLQTVMLEQGRDSLDPATTLRDALTDGRGDHVMVGSTTRHVASYMKDFLFTPEQARTPVGVLSGGERGRLMLARALAMPANLLILDEPTNDLDIETLDLLQETLTDHPGTVILVSHDRDFIDRVATSVLAYEGDGQWVEYAGGYGDMVAQRGEGVTARKAAEPPKPVKAATPSSAPPPAAAPRRKLSFKEKHALENLPGEIDRLHGEIAGLQAKLGDGNLFARDPKGFAATAAALEGAQTALAQAEEEWLRLELLREEIEGG